MKQSPKKKNFKVDPSIPKSDFGEYNITYYFLFPLLGIGKYFSKDKRNVLVNCFLKDNCRKSSIKDKLLLVLKKNNRNIYQFNRIHKRLKTDKNCIYSYYSGTDEEENDLYTYVFKIANYHLKYYRLIIEGKYSKLDSNYVHIIQNSDWIEPETKEIITRVVNKDKSLKEVIEEKLEVFLDEKNEVWPIISLERETFKKC